MPRALLPHWNKCRLTSISVWVSTCLQWAGFRISRQNQFTIKWQKAEIVTERLYLSLQTEIQHNSVSMVSAACSMRLMVRASKFSVSSELQNYVRSSVSFLCFGKKNKHPSSAHSNACRWWSTSRSELRLHIEQKYLMKLCKSSRSSFSTWQVSFTKTQLSAFSPSVFGLCPSEPTKPDLPERSRSPGDAGQILHTHGLVGLTHRLVVQVWHILESRS